MISCILISSNNNYKMISSLIVFSWSHGCSRLIIYSYNNRFLLFQLPIYVV